HLGETKLVTSISCSPASWRRWTRPILMSAGTGCFSFWRPSRGPTSTILTRVGSFMAFVFGYLQGCKLKGRRSVSALDIDHAGNRLSALYRANLARDLR